MEGGRQDIPPYEELVSTIDSTQGGWGVRRFHRSVLVALRARGLFGVFVAWFALALPGIWLCVKGPPHYAFVALAAVAAATARPGLSGLGLIGWSIATAILASAVIAAGPFPAFRGFALLYPVAAWFSAGAIRGITMEYVGRAIKRDRRVYEALRSKGLLLGRGGIQPL